MGLALTIQVLGRSSEYPSPRKPSWTNESFCIYRVLYIAGGCLGFLNHQQYEALYYIYLRPFKKICPWNCWWNKSLLKWWSIPEDYDRLFNRRLGPPGFCNCNYIPCQVPPGFLSVFLLFKANSSQMLGFCTFCAMWRWYPYNPWDLYILTDPWMVDLLLWVSFFFGEDFLPGKQVAGKASINLGPLKAAIQLPKKMVRIPRVFSGSQFFGDVFFS